MTIRLGIIGMSEGNGHPYSWSAIFNGFEQEQMRACPFPGIPAYLKEREYPQDFLSGAKVTSIWTQDAEQSAHIAACSRIESIVDRPSDMIGGIDGLLLARDDAENHLALAEPFLRAGIPVFIDKPVAISMVGMEELFSREKFNGQIFTCSALRYAPELRLSGAERAVMGKILHVRGYAPKSWEKYAVHAIESVISSFPSLGEIQEFRVLALGGRRILSLSWASGVTGVFETLGKDIDHPIVVEYLGTEGSVRKIFSDSFGAFRASLSEFLSVVTEPRRTIPIEQTRQIVNIIELGTKI